MRAIIFDTETTGIDEPQPIELAWVPWEPGGLGSEEPPFLARYMPTKPIDLGALATHHILLSELSSCAPSYTATLPHTEFLIGHNVDFDCKVMKEPLGKRICTLALARFAYPEFESHKLVALCYGLFGQTPETRERVKNAHSALDDVVLTRAVLERICADLKLTDLDALYLACEEARIPRKWSFGKFYNQPISAADRGYVNWYRRQPDTDPYLLEACRRAGLCG